MGLRGYKLPVAPTAERPQPLQDPGSLAGCMLGVLTRPPCRLLLPASAVQVLTVIFNLIYIGFSLDFVVEDKKPQAPAADVEAPQAPKK